MSTSVPISELCRIAGLSERGLRNAFYRVRGMSPKRSLRADRLRRARRALAGGNGPRTVTGVATRYGFYELGRFAAVYRESFGEAPSQTLRGTGRKTGDGNAVNTKGQGDACSS
jgi:transcriptional regulator GlxA family with amidase domain